MKKNVWLMGGFGNVLFQILAFNVLSKKHKDVSYVNTLTEKNYITNFLRWKIHQKSYNDLIDERDFKKLSGIDASIILFTSFLSKKFNIKLKKATYYNDQIQIDDFLAENIFGYFQDKFFLTRNKTTLLNLAEQLRSSFELKQIAPIVVHFRKGDSDWALKYYKYYDNVKIKLMQEVLPIIIVTDSVESAKLFFEGVQNVKILSSRDALDDFKYLVSCKKLYCAPSTFSWWAAHAVKQTTSVVFPRFFIDTLGFYNQNCTYEILD